MLHQSQPFGAAAFDFNFNGKRCLYFLMFWHLPKTGDLTFQRGASTCDSRYQRCSPIFCFWHRPSLVSPDDPLVFGMDSPEPSDKVPETAEVPRLIRNSHAPTGFLTYKLVRRVTTILQAEALSLPLLIPAIAIHFVILNPPGVMDHATFLVEIPASMIENIDPDAGDSSDHLSYQGHYEVRRFSSGSAGYLTRVPYTDRYADFSRFRAHRQASPCTVPQMRKGMWAPPGIGPAHAIDPSPPLASLPAFALPLEGTP